MASSASLAAPPIAIDGLSAVASDYRGLLVDIWGVLHNGRERFAAAEAACRRFRAERGPVILISNSPRPRDGVIAQLAAMGFGDDYFDDAVTSGEVTRSALAARAPGPVYALGPERDAHIYTGLGLNFADADTAAFVSCTGLVNDSVETPQDYEDLLAQFRARDLEMVCANPDIVVNHGGKLIYCAGALAEAYASMGGRVVLAGKPHTPIYQAALTRLGELDPAEVLAVGDGPHTDLAGAAAHGVDALFVMGHGVHASTLDGPAGDRAAMSASVDITAQALDILKADGQTARYVTRHLRW